MSNTTLLDPVQKFKDLQERWRRGEDVGQYANYFKQFNSEAPKRRKSEPLERKDNKKYRRKWPPRRIPQAKKTK